MLILGPTTNPPQSQSTPSSLPQNAEAAQQVILPSQTTSETNTPPDIQYPAYDKLPYITLDTDVVSDTMAARLAMSLLGHTLFLKSQVPLYVLVRISYHFQ